MNRFDCKMYRSWCSLCTRITINQFLFSHFRWPSRSHWTPSICWRSFRFKVGTCCDAAPKRMLFRRWFGLRPLVCDRVAFHVHSRTISILSFQLFFDFVSLFPSPLLYALFIDFQDFVVSWDLPRTPSNVQSFFDDSVTSHQLARIDTHQLASLSLAVAFSDTMFQPVTDYFCYHHHHHHRLLEPTHCCRHVSLQKLGLLRLVATPVLRLRLSYVFFLASHVLFSAPVPYPLPPPPHVYLSSFWRHPSLLFFQNFIHSLLFENISVRIPSCDSCNHWTHSKVQPIFLFVLKL